MKKTILTMVCITMCIYAKSQQQKLLQNYTYRVKNYKAIDVFFNTASAYSKAYQVGATGSFAAFSLGTNYTLINSTNKKLTQLGVFVNGALNTYKNTDENGDNDKNKTQSFSPNIYYNSKWYKKNNFIEVGTITNTNFINENATFSNNTITQRKAKNNYVDATLVLGVGTGRLENITDMQNAIWLSKTLQKNKSVIKQLTETEINDLAKTITSANNFRVLDGRKRLQYILKTVDEYLQRKQLVKKTDIDYFNNLNDILFFANNFFRLSGYNKFIRVLPTQIYNDYKNTTVGVDILKDVIIKKSNQIVLTVGVEKAIPLSVLEQINYGIAAKGNVGKLNAEFKTDVNGTQTTKNVTNVNWTKGGIAFNISYNLYPNTRTLIGTELSGDNGYQRANGKNGFYYSNKLSFYTNYFINYNTRFALNLSGRYNKDNYNSNFTFNNSEVFNELLIQLNGGLIVSF